MTPKQIPNGDLQLKKLPRNEADWETIQCLALTFDGYSYWGSFDRAAEIAESRLRDTHSPTCGHACSSSSVVGATTARSLTCRL